MAEKRIIEQESSNEVYSDDWFAKDSPTQDTSKILGSDLKAYMNEGMTSADTIADEYNSSTSYDIGDLCFYNGTLYVCTTATTGAWDGNDWSETTIEELIAESGKVQDVKVNGTSVVDVNKVAQIVSYKEVTQAEYNALPSSKNSDNVLYCIKDAVAPSYVEDVQVNGASLVTNKVAVLDSLTVDGTASGAIASFSDGSAFPMKSLKVAIEPQQDLHGYDAPWAGGAGKNKFDATLMTNPTANVQWLQMTLSANTQYTISSSIPYSATSAYIFCIGGTDTSSATSANSGVGLNTPRTVTSDNNGIISVGYRNVGADGTLNLANYTYQLELGSTATSYAPYSNICPISGWSAVDVTRCVKNLFSESNPNKWIFSDGQLSDDEGSMTSQLITAKEGVNYVLSSSTTAAAMCICFYDKNMNLINRVAQQNVNNISSTAPTNSCYLYASSFKSHNNLQLEIGSTPTTYEPYNGSTITIQLGDTYYGGKLDVVSGVLTVDRVKNIINQNSSIQFRSSGRALTFISDAYKTVTMGGTNIICDKLKSAYYANYDSAQNGEIATVSGSTAETGISFKISDSITSLDELKAWLTDNPLTIVTNLATPTTIQLTPTQVNSLLGVNNVWADCGDIINATYIRDLNITINNLINA